MDIFRNSLYDDKYFKSEWHPVIIAWYFKEWVNFNMAAHVHDRIEIMYVINGNCSVCIEGNQLLLKKGHFIFIDAGISHSLFVGAEGCRMLNVEFGFESRGKDIVSIGWLCRNYAVVEQLFKSKNPFILLKDSDEIYNCLKGLILELNRTDQKESFLIQSSILQLIIKIARLFGESILFSTSGENNEYVSRAKSYIITNYDTAITVSDIAAFVAVHPVHLERVFKKCTGESINQFLTKVRMDKAKMLLANTDIDVIDICQYVGIGSRQYFTYLFKKTTGTTPFKYRKSALQK